MRFTIITLLTAFIFYGCKSNQKNLTSIMDSQSLNKAYYFSHISIERYLRTEYLTVHYNDTISICEIRVESNAKGEKLNKTIELNENQKLELKLFMDMINNDSINGNVPGLSGRRGLYSFAVNTDTVFAESQNLFSLTKALNID